MTAPLTYVKLAGVIMTDQLMLPLGLSFYTFELITVLVFVYRGGRTAVSVS